MNYHHIYHAGNFADVFKHIILIMLLEKLRQKDKSFLYLDTHAGIGRYDLSSAKGQKAREYANGIAKILVAKNCPPVVEIYKNLVLKFNQAETSLRYYPGSPLIAEEFLRLQDRMILCELHHDDVQVLKQEFRGNKAVAVHHMNGYQAIKSFLPPKSGRGLVLIDPPFEEKDEFDKVVATLEVAVTRFPSGIYMVWYPIKDTKHIKKYINKINELHFKEVKNYEFSLKKAAHGSSLSHCGMLIINPPWEFEKTLLPVLDWLRQNVSA